MKPDGAVTIAFALITFACSFDDDRSLGSMNAAQLSNSGGTTNGGPSTTVVSDGGDEHVRGRQYDFDPKRRQLS